jgi:hypothetical protein
MRCHGWLWMVCAVSVGGCSSDGSPDPSPGAPDASLDPSIEGGGGGDAAPVATARLRGTVRRTVAPQGDAAGNVFVAVFDRDPIANRDTAQVVGNALVADVDLAVAGASVPYAVEAIPPRADAYFLIAFLDDNSNVDTSMPATAGPDRGDLVSLMGVSAPKIVVATPGDHGHDIELNLVMPF